MLPRDLGASLESRKVAKTRCVHCLRWCVNTDTCVANCRVQRVGTTRQTFPNMSPRLMLQRDLVASMAYKLRARIRSLNVVHIFLMDLSAWNFVTSVSCGLGVSGWAFQAFFPERCRERIWREIWGGERQARSGNSTVWLSCSIRIECSLECRRLGISSWFV